jgi:hypothetical protein
MSSPRQSTVSKIGPSGSTTEQYQDFTALRKTGASTWTLTGTMAATTPWTVSGGALDVEGSIASSSLTTVYSGGTLAGIGTVGATTIRSKLRRQWRDQPHNSALTSLVAELRFANHISLLTKFDGEFGSHSSTYAGTGTVRYTWQQQACAFEANH